MSGFNKDDKGYWIEKDPNAVLDYSLDWSSWLQADETINAATWFVTTGIVKSTEENTASISTVWLSGGTLGREYIITGRITTTSGRQDERSFRIRVKNR